MLPMRSRDLNNRIEVFTYQSAPFSSFGDRSPDRDEPSESPQRVRDRPRWVDFFYRPGISVFLSLFFAFLFCTFVAYKLDLHRALRAEEFSPAHESNSPATKELESQRFELVILKPSPFSEAVCLDGTPPGYNIKRGHGKGRNNWILIFQGGGWCYNPEECVERKRTKLGSSRHFSKHFTSKGIYSDDENINPNFHNWNAVEFNYCDGASFSGYRKQPLKVNDEIVYFRGQKLFEALMDNLFRTENLKDAKQVILGGWSAGGVAVLTFCDYARSLFPSSIHYSCLVDASLFMNIKDVSGELSFEEKFKSVFSMQNLQSTLDKNCINGRPDQLKFQCFFPRYSIPYVHSPIFFLNSLVDSWMVHNILAPPESDPTNLILRNCLIDNEHCSKDGENHIKRHKAAILQALSPFANNSEVGYFINSCPLHTTIHYDKYWSRLVINNKTLSQSFFEWHYGRGKRVVQLVQDGCDSI